MPSLRQKALREVFEKGVKAFSKEDLAELFKGAKNKLYRSEWDPKELLEEGFDIDKAAEAALSRDVPGLYYAKRKKDLEFFLGDKERQNVQGLLRPGARGIKLTLPKDSYVGEALPPGMTGEDLAKKYDYIERGLEGLPSEIIQLKPGNVLAKIKIGKENVYRILGLTGALGGSMAALNEPSEAEASPIGKLISKNIKGPASSAARRLIGHEISGMTIKNVVKGKEPWRYITFEGTDNVLPVTKDVLNDLARQFGEEMYTGIAETSRPAEAIKMAIKSAERRLDLKGTGSYTKEELVAMEAKHVNVLEALELQRGKQTDIIYRGERIRIPEVYADLLEKFNLAKRVKGK